MFYTIYITTNIINGKKYIGKHVTDNPYDDYIGSGKALTHAIKKHGRDNFKKQVLFIYDNEVEMNNKEIELITEEVIKCEDFYNIAFGGKGGNIVFKNNHPLYQQTCDKISQAQRKRRERMREITKENHKKRKVGMYGKNQSEKQKQAVREAQLGRKKNADSLEKQYNSLMKTLSSDGYVHPNTGKKRTAKQLEKMREITLNQPKKTCEHCSKSLDIRNYSRYHGDKCKFKFRSEYCKT